MFFLGIASSFMPYLLFMGVLLFLTFGTSKNSEVKLVNLEEKTIEDSGINAHHDLISETDYYFFETNEIQSTRDNFKSVAQNISQATETDSPLTNMQCIFVNHYGFQFYNSYSGLSPPCLIS